MMRTALLDTLLAAAGCAQGVQIDGIDARSASVGTSWPSGQAPVAVRPAGC